MGVEEIQSSHKQYYSMYHLQLKANSVRYAYKKKHGTCIAIYVSKCCTIVHMEF